MAGRSRILDVPYFVQPTGITCQSTCLRMMATFLEQRVVLQSTGAGVRDIGAIWKDINEDPKRPVRVRNAHANMQWWLERHFPSLRFEYLQTMDEAQAIESIVRFIDGGVPVLMSVSHVRVPGHIVLVIGYEHYVPNASTPDFAVVTHDPFGRFDPSLLSRVFGARRWEGGSSLAGGGEAGPGRGLRLGIASLGRQRAGDARRGTYYLLSARR
jgi:hypothetical protein